MTFVGDFQDPAPLRAAIRAATLADEEACVEALIREADPGLGARRRIAAMATTMVERIREKAATTAASTPSCTNTTCPARKA